MKIFISWSGSTSHAVAEALRDWLPDVIQEAEPWMSASDLEAGVRWAGEIGKSLEQTDFGIICLTPDNLEAPWILFEAGALSKRFDSARVLPYLSGVRQSDITGPMAQFQNVSATKDGTRRLVGAIYSVLPDTGLTPDRLDRAFERWWSVLESRLNAIPEPNPNVEIPPARSEDAVLNEILGSVRSLQRLVLRQESNVRSPRHRPLPTKDRSSMSSKERDAYYLPLVKRFREVFPHRADGPVSLDELDAFAELESRSAPEWGISSDSDQQE